MKLPVVIIIAVVVAVLAAGAGFFGGMTYAQAQTQNTANTFLQQRGVQGDPTQNGQNSGARNFAVDACGFPIRNAQGGQGQTNGQTNPQTGQNGQRPFGQFGGGVGGFGGVDPAQFGNCVARGQVKSVNGDTLEISTADRVIVVKVNDTTLISKTDKGALSDLQTGDRITVFSKETGDAPNASMIQLQRPVAPQQQSQ